MDNKENSIKDFTRGGQTFLHNLRMTNQIMKIVGSISLGIFIIATISLTYYLTNEYERYLCYQYCLAKFYLLASNTAKQSFINPNGQAVAAFSKHIVNSPFISDALNQVLNAFYKAMAISLIIKVAILSGMYRWFRRRGHAQGEVKHLRGDEIASYNEVKKIIKKGKMISDMDIAHLPMPNNFECRHILIHGTTGSGKSVCIRELLDQIKKRGDRAIIYDKSCSYIQTYYDKNKDIILNPLDARTSSWHLWNECRDSADYDSLASALIPMLSSGSDPFWVNAARTIFSATARQMQKEKDRSTLLLLKSLLTADANVMEKFLIGTEAEMLVSEKNEKTTLSIKAVLATYLKSLKYVRDEENPFSIRQWVQDDTQSNWVFVSSLSDRHETLKPLISMWLDLAVNTLMSLTPSNTRRIWIILDELPTLQKLPYLAASLAEARKFGGCLVAGIQSIAQLRKDYGHNGAEEISGLCNTRLFFRSPSADTAQWVSKELGQSEIEEMKEGISYSESAMRSGISISKQQTNKSIVNPSEIMRLNDLEAYIRLPGSFPITKVKLEYKAHDDVAIPFVPRQMDEKNLNEVNGLIDAFEQAGKPDTNKPVSTKKRKAKKAFEPMELLG